MDREFFMRAAIKQAQIAARHGEIPVGAVVVKNGEIIARAHNKREKSNNPIAHAEIKAIEKAAKKLQSWRLLDAELYVTLEPCAMCAGAIINSRIKNVFFGAYDRRFGAMGSICDVNGLGLNHKANVAGGILQPECEALLKDFFKKLRANP